MLGHTKKRKLEKNGFPGTSVKKSRHLKFPWIMTGYPKDNPVMIGYDITSQQMEKNKLIESTLTPFLFDDLTEIIITYLYWPRVYRTFKPYDYERKYKVKLQISEDRNSRVWYDVTERKQIKTWNKTQTFDLEEFSLCFDFFFWYTQMDRMNTCYPIFEKDALSILESSIIPASGESIFANVNEIYDDVKVKTYQELFELLCDADHPNHVYTETFPAVQLNTCPRGFTNAANSFYQSGNCIVALPLERE